jgi:hypothetical protein
MSSNDDLHLDAIKQCENNTKTTNERKEISNYHHHRNPHNDDKKIRSSDSATSIGSLEYSSSSANSDSEKSSPSQRNTKKWKSSMLVEENLLTTKNKNSQRNYKLKNINLRPTTTIRHNQDIEIRRNSKTTLEEKSKSEVHQKDRPQRFTQTKIITLYATNLPFGDDIQENADGETILFHNINGMKDSTNWFQILMTMNEINADIFGFAEINQQLNHGNKLKWYDTIRKHFYYSRSMHSESNIRTDSTYKPGGTITTVTGKWQARVSKTGSDSRGLGRWSFLQLTSKKKSLVIITAYRPCVSNGPTTSWMQQWTLLREEGLQNPDPIKIFYTDLDEQLTTWRDAGYEIILLIDANETIGDKPSRLTSIIGKNGLTDLIQQRHPHQEEIYTHARGSKQIDYILGTQGVSKHCHRSGITIDVGSKRCGTVLAWT